MYKHDDNLFKSKAWAAFSGESNEIKLDSDNFKVKDTSVTNLEKSYQTLIRLNIDQSSSMEKFSDSMNRAIKTIKDVIFWCEEIIQFKIAKTIFASSVQPEGYVELQKFDFSVNYSNGTNSTKLYDSIIDSERRNNKYAEKLMNNGITVNSVLFILSDGNDNGSISVLEEARESIKRMQNYYGRVIFVNFGGVQGKELAELLKIDTIVDPDVDIHDLFMYTGFDDDVIFIKKSQGDNK